MSPQIIKPTPKTLRQEIEANILAVNRYLKEKVSQMTWTELLCNCHPIERSAFAWRMYKTKVFDWNTLQRISPKKD